MEQRMMTNDLTVCDLHFALALARAGLAPLPAGEVSGAYPVFRLDQAGAQRAFGVLLCIVATAPDRYPDIEEVATPLWSWGMSGQ
jgi:hypothetical protein